MKKDIFNKIKSGFSNKNSNLFRKKVFSPDKAWRNIKIAFLVSFILVLAFGVFIFIAVDRGLFSGEVNNSSVLTTEINQNSIQELIKTLEQKKSNFEYFKTSESEVVDPYQN